MGEALRKTDPVVIMRHTRRVQVIGGRNNWRSHRPYRPTQLQPMDTDRNERTALLSKCVAAFVISWFVASYIGGIR